VARTAIPGHQLKVLIPERVHERLAAAASYTSLSMADLLRQGAVLICNQVEADLRAERASEEAGQIVLPCRRTA